MLDTIEVVLERHWLSIKKGSKIRRRSSRDAQLLSSHQVKRAYEVKTLNAKDAPKLLTWKAFKTEQVDPSYVKVLNRVVAYTSGLPLALEVIGSNLFAKSVEQLKSAVNKYKEFLIIKSLRYLK